MTTALASTAPWRSQGFAGFQGFDPPAMDGLVRLLEQAALALIEHRREVNALLVQAGVSPGTMRRMAEVEEWLAAATEDVRRRRAGAEAAATGTRTPTPAPPIPIPLPPPALPSGRGGGPVTPSTTPAPAVPVGSPGPGGLVSRTTSPAVFGRDGLSGIGLSGYAVLGLSYKHLGTETRTVTSVFEDTSGRRRTVVETQRRGVFQVQPGLGWETVAIVRFKGRRWYNPWAGAGKVVTITP